MPPRADKVDDSRVVVVACRVMEPELDAARGGDSRVEIRYIEQSLHRTPNRMLGRIQEELEQVSGYAKRIIIGYGLCSNGIVGLEAKGVELIVPSCHDCIALFMGSPRAYKEAFKRRPGTYYLTPGWIAERKDPLGILEEEYIPKYGEEVGVWVMEEEMKNYTHIAFINTGVGDIDRLRKRAMENARSLKKQYDEIPGTLRYFKRLIHGPYEQGEFFLLTPGQKITQEMYLS